LTISAITPAQTDTDRDYAGPVVLRRFDVLVIAATIRELAPEHVERRQLTGFFDAKPAGYQLPLQ
jgi:hypothetical protein